MNTKQHKAPRSRKMAILIACEGSETEPNYFKGLFHADQAIRNRFDLIVLPGTGGDARTVVNAAIKARNAAKARGETFDAVWCVMDVEEVTKAAELTEALDRARRENFSVALSNPSFEVWLIAHFERVSRSFSDSKAAESHLSKSHWHKHCGRGYKKGDVELYTLLALLMKDAIDNAEWVLTQCESAPSCRDCNSSTEVYRLVQYLRS